MKKLKLKGLIKIKSGTLQIDIEYKQSILNRGAIYHIKKLLFIWTTLSSDFKRPAPYKLLLIIYLILHLNSGFFLSFSSQHHIKLTSSHTFVKEKS